MKIVFVGAGNVATHLATELSRLGYDIVQIYSRSEESAKTLAEKLNTAYVFNLQDVYKEADVYIFSIKDAALQDIISKLDSNKGLWLHTAGSIPQSIFEGKVKNFGVLYPLQTFTKSKEIVWGNIPLFIEGSCSLCLGVITELANNVSNKVYPLSSDKRKYIHASAVFASNFTNHMYELSNRLVNLTELPFEILLPLIDETAAKVHTISPKDAQTGPAVRFDTVVMDKQLELIGDERMKELYRLISESICSTYKQ